MNPDEKSRIEELKKSLYSRVTPDIRTKRHLRFDETQSEVKTDWEHPNQEEEENIQLNNKYKDNSMSFFTKLFITSIVIFILALGAGAYLLFNGSNIVSAKNVDITINGPVSIAGGEPVSFDIQVSNRNNIKLETVDLSVDYPAGTVDSLDTSKELKNFHELMDDIEAGGIGQKTIKAVVYGEENSKKEIKVLVEYRVKGSNAVFKKEKTFDLVISSSPLSMSISSYKEVNSLQEFELSVLINSNSKDTIKNLLLKAIYPFGFTYISSDPKYYGDTSTWKIGDIPPQGKKIVKIKGKMEGQDDEIRVFRFNIGAQSVRNDKVIGTEYVASNQEISIKKPFISVGVSLDGDSEVKEYIGRFNDPIKVEISYFNNLPTSIIDEEIHVKLSGSAFDKAYVSPEQGLYKSASNEIIWNSITTPSLRNIGAGESGRVSFEIIPKNLTTSKKTVINPSLAISVNIQGKRNSENNVPESISSVAERYVKISSNITLGGQVVRSVGPFDNTGPIPPKAEKSTSYTVIWTVDNTSSTVTNAIVKSSLPSYVKWLGKISPSSEDITYNSVDGQIYWKVGNIDTYTLNGTKRRQVAFQVAIEPSIAQVGQVPVLVNDVILTAQDDFTNESLSSNLSSLTTRFSTDPAFNNGDERIVK
jgi:hypothetical protein